MFALILTLSLFTTPAAAQEAGAVPAVEEEALPTQAELAAYLEGEGLSPEEAAQSAAAILAEMEFEASLTYQTGEIAIADGRATLTVPEDFGYLSPEDSDSVLVAWGNLPGVGAYGMLVPAGLSLFSEEGWAVIIDYEEDGYVSDEDAADIDYDELLTEMQEGTEASNEARVAAGITSLHLDGWAEPPSYDAQSHKMYWAKLLSSDDGGRSLNYDVRVLGRQGVLSMSAVAGASEFSTVKQSMERVLAFAEFNDGHRYTQFDPGVDKVAAYGIGALVAGKVAAKVGFFKGLMAMMIAGKKFVVIGVIAAAAALKKLFGRGGDS